MTTSTDRHGDVLLHVAARRDPTGLFLQLHGELDIATAQAVVDTAEEHILAAARVGTSQKQVVVDVSHLVFLDVSGVRALLQVRAIVLSAGGEMSIAGASRVAMRLFELAGVTRILEVHPVPRLRPDITESATRP